MTRRKADVHSCIYLVLFLTLASGVTLLSPERSRAQQADSARKVLEKAPAPYPPLARNMGLQGTVKLEVLVSPEGSVKETQIKGGHPVLAQAAINSVRRWKWETATHESHETVEIKFTPE
jgi:TonB family protein